MFGVYFGLTVLVVNARENSHVVKKGESLYSLSKQYGVTVADISRANNFATASGVRVGQHIIIPSKGTSAENATSANKELALNNVRTVPAKLHTVAKGETVYAICKKYGVTAAQLKQWNSLNDLNLKMGQKLVVSKVNSMALYKAGSVPSTPDTPYREEDIRPRTMSPEVGKASAVIEDDKIIAKPLLVAETQPIIATQGLRTTSSNSADYPVIFNQYSSHGYKIKKNKGAANYLDQATSGNQNLAFYNDAETGSVIRVTNLMNHKTVFVKVVGKVPPMDASSEVTVKLSHKAASDLGALDEKFLVEVASFSN